MEYAEALDKLEELRSLMDAARKDDASLSDEERAEMCMLYGELEEVVTRAIGVSPVVVPQMHDNPPVTFNNLIEAGYFSCWTTHRHQGYAQLLRVIGRVRALAEDPNLPQRPQSVAELLRTLGRFRECCQYVQVPPKDEREVQDIIWIMLRSQHDHLEREEGLPRFGAKGYRPDFGVPDLDCLVEVKFIGEKTDVPSIQESVLADVPGYLSASSRYKSLIVFVYDYAHKLRDAKRFIEDLRSVAGIVDVLVVPGIGQPGA
jgi:hypothetical protein